MNNSLELSFSNKTSLPGEGILLKIYFSARLTPREWVGARDSSDNLAEAIIAWSPTNKQRARVGLFA